MKSSLKALVSADSAILERIGKIANLLPPTGPEPEGISLARGGCITYPHDPDTTPLIGLAFGLTGWRCEIPRGSAYIDLVKRLSNGVNVRVLRVTEVEFNDEVPLEFFTGGAAETEGCDDECPGCDNHEPCAHRRAMRRVRRG